MNRPAFFVSLKVSMLLLVLAALAACGTKGALVLPDQAAKKKPAATQSAPPAEPAKQ